MGGEALRLGPFSGGLNTTSDPSTIADVELAECLNFEQDLDGSLRSRPPFKEIFGHQNFTDRILFLCEAIFGTDHYLICSNSTGVYYFINGTFTLITNTFEAGAAVQYADKVYLVPKPGSGSGGKWDPTVGFTAVASIPKGQAAVIHKERMYVCPGIKSTTDTSRLKFSDPSNLDSWPAGNFIDIRQGDGNKLVDLTVYQDNILLFKEQSISILSYDANPADAFLRPVSNTIGVNRQFNVVNYENQVYIFSGGWIYEITNLDFLRLNVKVPFIRDDTAPSAFSDEFIFLSLLEDRLICRYYRKIYIYGLRTRTWSEWKSDKDTLHYFGPIATVRLSTGNEYYAGSCIGNVTTAIKFLDKANSTDTERAFNTTALVTDTATRTVSNGLGVSDSGHTYTNNGAASDYGVNGTKIFHTLGSLNSARYSVFNGVSIANFDYTVTFETDKLAATQNQRIEFHARFTDFNNGLLVRVEFTPTQTVVLSLIKGVAGVFTTLFTGTIGGLAHAVNKQFTVRFKGTGSILQVKVWETLSGQPAGWNTSISDSAIIGAAGFLFLSFLPTGTTTTLPVTAKFDNITIINTDLVTSSITCSIRTKNFDMATSHQFKRLWWWGLDCITNNSVTGVATPVTSSFTVGWDDLGNYTWDQLNTWDQPLTAPTLVQTVRATGMGVVRQFIKFDKALRYRQINFAAVLTTVGSTLDGPAKIFTMTALTRPAQVVSKAVS